MMNREKILQMACEAGLRNSNPGAAQEILRFAAMLNDFKNAETKREMMEAGVSVKDAGLTNKERIVLDQLAAAWNAWAVLPNRADSDMEEFQTAIHSAQNLIALRVARRVDPDVWRMPI